MKKLLLIILLPLFLFSQEIITRQDGQKILLNPDGSWEYIYSDKIQNTKWRIYDNDGDQYSLIFQLDGTLKYTYIISISGNEGQTYDKGLEDLKQSKKSISRVYRMTGKDIGKYGNYDGDNAEEMELSFGIDGMKFPLYMDYHATTPVDERVFEEMKPYFTENFGNASSIDHSFGYDASVAVQTARETISNAVGCKMDEIIFTSGATESDNLALIGVMEKNKEKGNHLITCKTEHKAILDCAKHLEENGCEVTYLSVNDKGEIDLNELEGAITEKTVLISLMAANNEIGTIANLEEIGKIAHKHDVLFHTDAAQAVGHIPIDVEKINIDLMSFSSHKIYGPKGIGALYVRSMKPRVKLDLWPYKY